MKAVVSSLSASLLALAIGTSNAPAAPANRAVGQAASTAEHTAAGVGAAALAAAPRGSLSPVEPTELQSPGTNEAATPQNGVDASETRGVVAAEGTPPAEDRVARPDTNAIRLLATEAAMPSPEAVETVGDVAAELGSNSAGGTSERAGTAVEAAGDLSPTASGAADTGGAVGALPSGAPSAAAAETIPRPTADESHAGANSVPAGAMTSADPAGSSQAGGSRGAPGTSDSTSPTCSSQTGRSHSWRRRGGAADARSAATAGAERSPTEIGAPEAQARAHAASARRSALTRDRLTDALGRVARGVAAAAVLPARDSDSDVVETFLLTAIAMSLLLLMIAAAPPARSRSPSRTTLEVAVPDVLLVAAAALVAIAIALLTIKGLNL